MAAGYLERHDPVRSEPARTIRLTLAGLACLSFYKLPMPWRIRVGWKLRCVRSSTSARRWRQDSPRAREPGAPSGRMS